MDQKLAGEVAGKKRSTRKKVGVMKNIETEKAIPAGSTGESDHEMHIWTERERRKKMRNMFSSLHDLLPPNKLPLKADKSSIVDEAVKYIKALEHTLQTLEKQRFEKLRSCTTSISTSTIDHDQAPSVSTKSYQHDQTLIDQTRDQSVMLADYCQRLQYSKNSDLLKPRENSSDLLQAVAWSFQTWFSPNVVVNMCGEDAQISICSPRKPGILATIFYILEKHKLDVISAHICSDPCRSMFMIHAQAGRASKHFAEALSVEDIFKLAAGEMNLWILSCN